MLILQKTALYDFVHAQSKLCPHTMHCGYKMHSVGSVSRNIIYTILNFNMHHLIGFKNLD